jgi:hypothetical protein
MDWLFSFIGKALEGVGVLIGSGIGAAGEKVGTSLPAVRPMDKIATARRMSRDQKELYNLYQVVEEFSFSSQCWV